MNLKITHWVVIAGYTPDYYIVRDVGSGKAERALVDKKDWMFVKQAYEITG